MQRRKKETQKTDEEIREPLQTESKTNEENLGSEVGKICIHPGGTKGRTEEKTNGVLGAKNLKT